MSCTNRSVGQEVVVIVLQLAFLIFICKTCMKMKTFYIRLNRAVIENDFTLIVDNNK